MTTRSQQNPNLNILELEEYVKHSLNTVKIRDLSRSLQQASYVVQSVLKYGFFFYFMLFILL